MNTNKSDSPKLKVNQLTSLVDKEYEMLLDEFNVQVTKRLRRYTLQGQERKRIQLRESKNSSLYGSSRKLDFMLLYFKENMNQTALGIFFKISQPKVSQWFSFLLPALEYSLDRLGYSPELGSDYHQKDDSTEYISGDVTERELPRKRCYDAQKEDFSGKHHKHTEKNFALCSPDRYIHFISYSYTGSTHDKSIYDDLNIEMGNVPFLLDLGFQGVEEKTIILPYKKPKGKKLNHVQKQLNKAMSKLRVRIEHAFAGVKRFKIMRDKIRIPCYSKRQCIVKIAVAIHNLRVSMRKSLINNS